MAINERKKQKKLAKKKGKRKLVAAAQRVVAQVAQGVATAREALAVANHPVHECLAPTGLFEVGMGTVLIARKIPGGGFGIGVFLLDVFCLGVKNAFFAIVTADEYEDRKRMIGTAETLERIHHSCARKLVEGAAAYAKELGFRPHADYRAAAAVFGDIDPGACAERFVYGKDGKPLYIAGPNESAAQSRTIIQTLHKRLGEDGAHFVLPLDPKDLP